MKDKFAAYCEELEKDIQAAYEAGVTLEHAERLAAKFLQAQMTVSSRMTGSDLDSRMRKSGVKALKAKVYLDAATQGEKKPSDVLLNNIVDSHQVVQEQQRQYDQAEVTLGELQRYYDIFLNAHIYFRGLAKGGSYGS